MVLTRRTKRGMIRQIYNMIDGFNFRAEAKPSPCKNAIKHRASFPGANSTVITLVKVGLKRKYFSNIQTSGRSSLTTLKRSTSKTLQRPSWIGSGKI